MKKTMRCSHPMQLKSEKGHRTSVKRSIWMSGLLSGTPWDRFGISRDGSSLQELKILDRLLLKTYAPAVLCKGLYHTHTRDRDLFFFRSPKFG